MHLHNTFSDKRDSLDCSVTKRVPSSQEFLPTLNKQLVLTYSQKCRPIKLQYCTQHVNLKKAASIRPQQLLVSTKSHTIQLPAFSGRGAVACDPSCERGIHHTSLKNRSDTFSILETQNYNEEKTMQIRQQNTLKMKLNKQRCSRKHAFYTKESNWFFVQK